MIRAVRQLHLACTVPRSSLAPTMIAILRLAGGADQAVEPSVIPSSTVQTSA